MKISEYYLENAKASLNSSILFLFPAVFLVLINILFFQNKNLMLLSVPFIGTSFLYFQSHLVKTKEAAETSSARYGTRSPLLEAKNLLAFYESRLTPGLLLFSPSGLKAGEIRKAPKRFFFKSPKLYQLMDDKGEIVGEFEASRGKINIFNGQKTYVGSFIKREKYPYGGGIEVPGQGAVIDVTASRMFMDVKIISNRTGDSARLRRGIMPVEWCAHFREPNTPVLTFGTSFNEAEKLLAMAVLIDEFFVER